MKTALAHRAPSRQTRRRGFTLTEIAIVLGIVGLILGAIWVAAAAVYTNLRVSHADTEVLQIAQGVRTLFATSNTTGASGDLTSSLITAGIIPTDIANTTLHTATNPWAGGWTKVLAPAAAMDSFTVELGAVPQAACIGLLAGVAGTSRDASLFAVGATTANGPVNAATAGTALPTTPGQVNIVTPTIAASACSSPTNNTVQFGFGLK